MSLLKADKNFPTCVEVKIFLVHHRIKEIKKKLSDSHLNIFIPS